MSLTIDAEISAARGIVRPKARRTTSCARAHFAALGERLRCKIVDWAARPFRLGAVSPALRNPRARTGAAPALPLPDAAAAGTAETTGASCPGAAGLHAHLHGPASGHAPLNVRPATSCDHSSVIDLQAVANAGIASPAAGHNHDAPVAVIWSSGKGRTGKCGASQGHDGDRQSGAKPPGAAQHCTVLPQCAQATGCL
jgi:hypothetical protein